MIKQLFPFRFHLQARRIISDQELQPREQKFPDVLLDDSLQGAIHMLEIVDAIGAEPVREFRFAHAEHPEERQQQVRDRL